MILINCDIGERGLHNPEDMELMENIDIANIACGGHAGNKESVDFYLELCKKNSVIPTAHLSYPDRENFGRVTIDIELETLGENLNRQYKLMPDVKKIKFHGALYNDSCTNINLADYLTNWLLNNKIEEVITPSDSILATKCRSHGIKIMAEAFAERRYFYNKDSNMLNLVPRSKSYASIDNITDAMEHSKNIIFNKQVGCLIEEGLKLKKVEYPIIADTICIHSDSSIALSLAKKLKELGV